MSIIVDDPDKIANTRCTRIIIISQEKVCNLIENRVGFEKFQDAIGGIVRHEIYSRTLKHPQPSAKNPSELLLDHEFCRLLKSLEGIYNIYNTF